MSSSKGTPLPMLSLRERDFQILETVGACGGLTALHLTALFFPPYRYPVSVAHSNCERRLKLLHMHGYLARIEQPQILSDGRKPFVHTLTKKGAQILAHYVGCELSELQWRVLEGESEHFLDHLLLTNNVRIALLSAMQQRPNDVAIQIWRDDVTLKRLHSQDRLKIELGEGRTETRILVPDGYVLLSGPRMRDFRNPAAPPSPRELHHFLEIDRATETGASRLEHRRTWAKKIKMYLAYYEQFYEQRYGTKGLRILTVTTSHKRMENLMEITERAGGRFRFWFTTFERISTEHILTEPIWRVVGREEPAPLLLL